MIMCSYKKIAITNREIFRKYHPGANSEEYAGYIRRLAEKLDYVILREKDLTEAEYEKFARLVLDGWKETQEKLISAYLCRCCTKTGASPDSSSDAGICQMAEGS